MAERVISVYRFVEHYKDVKKKDLQEFVLSLSINYFTGTFSIVNFENLKTDFEGGKNINKAIAFGLAFNRAVQFAKSELDNLNN